MNREQIIQDMIAKLQQLPDARLEEAHELFVAMLNEINQQLPAEPKSYPLPSDDENRYLLEEEKGMYKTGIYSRLQALSETLKTSTDQVLLKTVRQFISLLISEREDELLTQGIMKLAEQSKSYHFLLNEEDNDLYKVEDLKEVYNAKR